MVAVLVLALVFPQSAHSLQEKKPTSGTVVSPAVVRAISADLTFAPTPAPDYDVGVLVPLRAAQKAHAEAIARQAVLEAAQRAEAARLAAIPVTSPIAAPASSGAVQQSAVGPMQSIFNRESGGNAYAINKSSGACGLGQALPCSKLLAICPDMAYACQVQFFTEYANARYGGWNNAYAFWLNNSWW